MKDQILNFLKTNPNEEEVERFYCKYILPKTKLSMSEILEE